MSNVDNQLPLYDESVITSQLTASLNSVIDCRAPIVIILTKRSLMTLRKNNLSLFVSKVKSIHN